MPKKKSENKQMDRWQQVDAFLRLQIPHFMAWQGSQADFNSVKFLARDDGTTLAVAKGYAADGSPVVCFGVGYGMVMALMALDGTMQGDGWRVDRPWSPE